MKENENKQKENKLVKDEHHSGNLNQALFFFPFLLPFFFLFPNKGFWTKKNYTHIYVNYRSVCRRQEANTYSWLKLLILSDFQNIWSLDKKNYLIALCQQLERKICRTHIKQKYHKLFTQQRLELTTSPELKTTWACLRHYRVAEYLKFILII